MTQRTTANTICFVLYQFSYLPLNTLKYYLQKIKKFNPLARRTLLQLSTVLLVRLTSLHHLAQLAKDCIKLPLELIVAGKCIQD